MPTLSWKRQSLDNGNDNNSDLGYYDDYGNWWWTPTGMAIRYAIIAVLFALILLYFVGGYYHARRRLRKNLPPLQYHRWMVRSRQPQYAHGQPYYHPQSFGMNQYPPQHGYQNGQGGYVPPPPAYGHYEAPPPVYQPPAGGSKVAADQHYGGNGQREQGEGSSAPAVHVRES